MPTPSLVNIPFITAPNVLFSQIPESGAGDFTVTRATTPTAGRSTRVNAAGNIETVADNVPRIDYPFGGAVNGCPALLVEPSASNGILSSIALTGANWTVGDNLTRTQEVFVGLNGANLTVITAGSGVGSSLGSNVRASNNITLTSGLTYTISFFVKITGTHTIAGYYVPITGDAAGNLGGGFDVSGAFPTGVVYGSANVTNRIRRVEAWGGGVFRCSETFTMGANGLLTNIFLAPIVAVNNQSNSAVGTQLAFAGPQVEQNSVPTSFIPTATAAVTRSAEIITDTTAGDLIGQGEGTIYAEVNVRNFGNVGMIASISNATYPNRLEIYKFTDGKIYFDRLSATQSALTSVGSTATYTTPTILKIAVGYRSGDTIMYINGVAATAQQTQTFTFATLTKANIGSSQSDGSILNDRIRAVELYSNRLSNLRLEFLTAPVTYTTYAQMANALSYILP